MKNRNFQSLCRAGKDTPPHTHTPPETWESHCWSTKCWATGTEGLTPTFICSCIRTYFPLCVFPACSYQDCGRLPTFQRNLQVRKGCVDFVHLFVTVVQVIFRWHDWQFIDVVLKPKGIENEMSVKRGASNKDCWCRNHSPSWKLKNTLKTIKAVTHPQNISPPFTWCEHNQRRRARRGRFSRQEFWLAAAPPRKELWLHTGVAGPRLD